MIEAAAGPEFSTMGEAFAASAGRYADLEFLQLLPETATAFGVAPRSWTYREASTEVARLRAAYELAGYGRGQRVGLLLRNRPEFIFHWLALNGLGVSVVPISSDWRANELEFLIGHSEIGSIVCTEERAREVVGAATAAGRHVTIVSPDGHDIGPSAGTAALHERPSRASECALLYTSGTTGQPKGCVLSNEYFLHAGHWYATIGGLCEIHPGRERLLTPLPLTHMNSMAYSATCMMLTGGCLILLDRFHPRTWWRNVREARATVIHYLGVMPALLLGAPESADDREHAVRFGFGAGVSPRHHAPFEQRFGFPLVEAWAMTETGAGAVVIANREPRQVGTACFGAPQPDVACRVVDESGAEVEAGVIGELLVRRATGPERLGFFREYLKDPAASMEAWAGGWFHTGDLVAREPNGRFRFVDRRKNLIRRSGENISAVEVEAALVQHPSVKTAGVTAVADELRGDEVFACIVLSDPAAAGEPLARALADFCRERLAYFKAPGYLAFVSSLPLTPTEKIQRSALRDQARRLLDERQCIDLRSQKRQRDA